MLKYLCINNGGQWNVPVEIVYRPLGLGEALASGVTSDLVGLIGSDGHCYTLCYTNELFDIEQLSAPANNVVRLR